MAAKSFFVEQVSLVQRRKGLEKALKFVRKGDTLVVTKLDRLPRSVPDLVKIMDRLEGKGASLRILVMNLDTHTPTGLLMINLVGSIAQFEREIMLELQRAGISKTKDEGKYKGRAATARARADEALTLRKVGKGASEIAQTLGIGRASVDRMLKDPPA